MGRARILSLAALLALALFAAACGSSDPSDSANDASPEGRAQRPSASPEPSADPSTERTLPETVRLAYKETTAADTAKVAFRGTVTGVPATSGQPANMCYTGQGAVDYANEATSMTMRMPMFGEMEVRSLGSVMYVRFPGELADGMLGGKPWAKMDLDEVSREQFGASLSEMQGVSLSPEQQLGYLRGVSDSVEKLGEGPVRGTPTTHYRATVDLEEAAAEEKDAAVRQAYERMREQIGASELPMEVWLDGEDRVRRIKTVTPVPEEPTTGGASDGKAGGQGKMTMVYEYYDFGAPVRVSPPPAGQTADITDMALQQAPASSAPAD